MKHIRIAFALLALAALSGCVAVPVDAGYYDPAPVYVAPAPVYYGPSIFFGIHGHRHHYHGGRHRHR